MSEKKGEREGEKEYYKFDISRFIWYRKCNGRFSLSLSLPDNIHFKKLCMQNIYYIYIYIYIIVCRNSQLKQKMSSTNKRISSRVERKQKTLRL